jgi:hypothetical protein
MCSTPAVPDSTGTVQTAISNYLQNRDSSTYQIMSDSIQNWMYGVTNWTTTVPNSTLLSAIGLPLGTTLIKGFHVSLASIQGERLFDSRATTNNANANIGVPADDFLTTGKYKIGKTTSLTGLIGSSFSTTGTFIEKYYSSTDRGFEYALTVRQSDAANNSAGVVRIILSAQPGV